MSNNIGESVLLSYFKYVKKCPICYTNWRKPKGEANLDRVRNIYKELCNNQKVNTAFSCRGKTRALETLLNETEIDVIGFKGDVVYIADVAFHSNGLGYRDNKDKVFTKLVRFCLVCLQYFSDYKTFEIMFTSPIVRDDDKEKLDEVAKEVKLLFQDYFNNGIEIKCKLNEDFSKDILEELVKVKDNISEEDYFLRSLQLLRICNVELPKYEEVKHSAVDIKLLPDEEKFIEELMKKRTIKRKWHFNDETVYFEDTWNAANLVEKIKDVSKEDKIKKIKNNVRSCSKYRTQYESELSSIELIVE